MQSSVAHLFLGQLRRDLSRLHKQERRQLNGYLNRSERYLERVSVDNLRLEEAFAAARHLGFRPMEYLAKIYRIRAWKPESVVGHFSRRIPKQVDQSGLTKLQEFVSWGMCVDVDISAPPFQIDLFQQVSDLGVIPQSEDILDLASGLFSILSRHRPEIIHPDTALSLSLSLSLIADHLIEGHHLSAACQVLDLGFRFGGVIGKAVLKARLYEAGAKLSLRLGSRMDALWCLKEAAEAALWSHQATEAFRLHRGFLELVGDSDAGNGLNVLETARREVNLVLEAWQNERSQFGAKRLDFHLGASRAFSKAKRGIVPLTVARWGQMLALFRDSPYGILRRSQSSTTFPGNTGGVLHRLGKDVETADQFEFQAKLLTWSEVVAIDSTISPTGFFEHEGLRGHPNEVYSLAVETIEKWSARLPNHLHPEDLFGLTDSLLKIGWILRRRSSLGPAVDFHRAAFHLLDRMPQSAQTGTALRMAGYLALDLGSIDDALIFFRRTLELDLGLENCVGLKKTLFGMGLCAHLVGDFLSAIDARAAALALGSPDDHELNSIIHFSQADTYLHLDRITEAIESLEQVSVTRWANEMDHVAYLTVRAECASIQGNREAAESDFRAAIELISSRRHRDLLILNLRFYNHFIRFNLPEQAIVKAVELLGLLNRAAIDSVTKRAVEKLVSQTFDGTDTAQSLRSIVKRIKFPSLGQG